MQLCILKVCITHCIQFTINAHRYRISFSSYSSASISQRLFVLPCTSYACSTLATTYPTTATIINLFASYLEFKFDVYLPPWLLFSSSVPFFVSTPHIWPKMDMPIQYRFGRWIYNAIYIKDASTYLGILIQALVPYCPGSVIIPSHSNIIWPCNSL